MLDILIYRLYRSRRVILLGLIPTLATLSAILIHTGQSYLAWVALGVILPLAHALIYPNNWTETLTVSLVTSVCLALASTISPDLATGAFFMRCFWLVFLWFVLFLVLVHPMSLLGVRGPISDAPVGAVATSRLDAETLKAAITYFPGRKDNRVVCGEADDEGRFPVTLRQEFSVLTCEDEPSPEMLEAGIDENGVMETHGSAVIHSTGADHHEIFYFGDEFSGVTACKYSFIDLGENGTRIVMEEVGTQLHAGQRFGMWISDYLADYLTDHIDAAEQRPARANRAFRHKQFVVDLANVLVPVLNALSGDTPNNQKR